MKMDKSAKTKVLHLISGDLWAGAEVQALTLITRLRQYPEFELLAVVFNEGRLSHELKMLGMPVFVFDESKHNPLYLLLKLRRVLSEEKIVVLHTHRYKENILGAVAARLSGCRHLVKTVHGLSEPFKGIKKAKADLYRFLDYGITRLYFTKIICVSQDIERRLKRRFTGVDAVCVHNGLDLEKIRPSRPRVEVMNDLAITSDSVIIGTAGRLVAVKGVDCLLHAAKILAESLPCLTVLVIGDGPERENLKAQACRLGLQGRVVFTGHRNDALDLIAAMDLFVLPSLSEGIPMVLLEAMTLGIPIVASNVGGIPEVIADGDTGILVEPRNESALARACQLVLEDHFLKEKIRDNAKRRVSDSFSAKTMAEKVAMVYHSMVSNCA